MMRWGFVHGSYYLLWAMLALWAVSLFAFVRTRAAAWKPQARSIVLGAVISLAAVTWIFATVPSGLKILNDEVRLLSVSKSMLEENRCDSVKAAIHDEGKTRVMARIIEKRPLLFPFLTHLVHRVTGYDVRHPLVVNFIFSWGVLFLVFWLVLRASGSAVLGVAAAAAVLAHPVFSISATAGGMEIVNLFFIILSFIFLRSYLENPDDVSFRCLLMTLIVGSHARYESVLFLGVTIAVLLATRAVSRQIWMRSMAYLVACTAFLFPIFSQRWIRMDSQEPSWVVKPFNISRIPHQTRVYIESLANNDLGVNNIVNAAGLLACVFFVVYLFMRRSSASRVSKIFYMTIFTNMTALWLLITAYFAGDVTGRFSARFFMVHGTLFSIAVVLFVSWMLKRIPFRQWMVLAAFSVLAVLYHPGAVKNIGVRESYFRRDYAALSAWALADGGAKRIYIYRFPEYFLVQGRSAVDFGTAGKNWRDFESYMGDRSFEIYVVLDRDIEKEPIPKKYRIAGLRKERFEFAEKIIADPGGSFYAYKVS